MKEELREWLIPCTGLPRGMGSLGGKSHVTLFGLSALILVSASASLLHVVSPARIGFSLSPYCPYLSFLAPSVLTLLGNAMRHRWDAGALQIHCK